MKITSKDWKILSRNEREISLGGRHFYACRYSMNPKAGWKIIEFDKAGSGAKHVADQVSGVATKQLSQAVENIVAEAPGESSRETQDLISHVKHLSPKAGDIVAVEMQDVEASKLVAMDLSSQLRKTHPGVHSIFLLGGSIEHLTEDKMRSLGYVPAPDYDLASEVDEEALYAPDCTLVPNCWLDKLREADGDTAIDLVESLQSGKVLTKPAIKAKEMEAELRRFYSADGSYVECETVEEAKEKRLVAAQSIAELNGRLAGIRAANEMLQKERDELAAHVERLRAILEPVSTNSRDMREEAYEALSETPTTEIERRIKRSQDALDRPLRDTVKPATQLGGEHE